jgi:hypothetical protein
MGKVVASFCAWWKGLPSFLVFGHGWKVEKRYEISMCKD